MQTFARANSIGLSTIAFASYFDVYSHSHIFIGIDPWWNPAHLLLYTGFGVIAYGITIDRPKNFVGRLSLAGVGVAIAAALFNEVWHRMLLFGNPLPEPFPVEPPHALLAVGIIMLGSAALLHPLTDASVASETEGRIEVAFTAGSLWLVTAGSAFYVGGVYGTDAAYLFAVGVGSFTASLFVVYSSAVAGRLGYSTISYVWFLSVYFLFFIHAAEWIPLGIPLVASLDYVISRRAGKIGWRLFILAMVALLYGIIYYPILPAAYTIAINAGLVASALGAVLELIVEKSMVARLGKLPRQKCSTLTTVESFSA